MNPHLQLLLGRVYDGALAPEHRADLEKSGLTMATIRASYIRSVPPAMIEPLLGRPHRLQDLRSAYLIPFRSPRGGFMDHVRLRLCPPFASGCKYLQPTGSAPRLYFPGWTMEDACTGTDPVWLIEGEKKALAVAQLGEPAIGFCGIEGWHAGGTCELLPDFADVRLDGRPVKLWPDADWRTNPHVHRGVRRFANALLARGAVVELVMPEVTHD